MAHTPNGPGRDGRGQRGGAFPGPGRDGLGRDGLARYGSGEAGQDRDDDRVSDDRGERPGGGAGDRGERPGGGAGGRRGRPAGGSGGAGSGTRGGPGGPGALRAAASRYALLPLRVFLGVTFVYAGLDKLTDPGFLAASGTGSLGELMRSVRDGSAVPWLVDTALRDPVLFGYAIGVGEVAVGLGTLAGLWARVAAAGGALISLSLWLTVSWQSDPYYYGNDLAYLMAWLPLVLAGASAPSVDAALAARRRRSR
ncbi:hypothetical protein SUDANB38_03694 [Streptomyces sp. enrichment culture]